MAKEYIATFKDSVQIAEDAYRVIHPALKITDETTVAEIEVFYRKYCKTGATEVTIIEIQATTHEI